MPERGEKNGLEKFEAKVAKKERREREKRQRLAAMTPEQRARHEAWQVAHVPGPKSARAAAKAKKGHADWFGGIVAGVDAKRAADEARRLDVAANRFRNCCDGVFG